MSGSQTDESMTMTLIETLTLFAIMAALAALPSSSVALVVARSAMHGRVNGYATALGIVAADLAFVALAILGMAALAEQMGAFFVVVKYLAAAYLVWLGFSLIRSQFGTSGAHAASSREAAARTTGSNLVASFAAGFLLTLGDVKAILFYASLFPTFLDLGALTSTDIATVVVVTILAVGGVKMVYAALSERIAGAASGLEHVRNLKLASGAMLMTIGGYLALKA
ncbi:MAG: LysE family translocator [Pseudomonadota bacterium]